MQQLVATSTAVPNAPLDLRNILLPKELHSLAEELAQLVHECWITQKLSRIRQGEDGIHIRMVPFDMLMQTESSPTKFFVEVCHPSYLCFHVLLSNGKFSLLS